MQRNILAALAMLAVCPSMATTAVAQIKPASKDASAKAPTSIVADDPEYHLSGGDKIHVIVFGEDTLTGDYVLTSAGNLSFPLVGNIHATDKTVEQLQKLLATALSDGYLVNPRVNIQVLSFRPFYILGEVNRPGEYPVSTGLTLEQAVASAGGYTYRANTRRIYVKPANETNEKLVDVRTTPAMIIHAGDTIRIRERHF